MFVARHPVGVVIAIGVLLLFIMIFAGLSSCASIFSGGASTVVGTSYVAEDAEMIGAEQDYAALEANLQSEIDAIEKTHPGYDEYRYDLDTIGHDPYVLTSILTALHLDYTRADVQDTLQMLFEKQYILTLTEEVETLYRTETRTGTRTVIDPETGKETTETYEYEVQVPYDERHILHVSLENFDLSHLPVYIMDEETLSLYATYMQTLGNRPDLFPTSSYPVSYTHLQQSRKNSGGICGGHRADGASFLKIPSRCRLCCTLVAGLVAGEIPITAGFFPYQQPKQQKNKRKYKL